MILEGISFLHFNLLKLNLHKILALSLYIRMAFLRPIMLLESGGLKIIPDGNSVSKVFKVVYFTKLLSQVTANKTEGKQYTSTKE